MKTFLSVDRRLLNPQAIENVELKVAVPTKDTKNNPLFIQDMLGKSGLIMDIPM